MRITSLVDDRSDCGFEVEHGLSLLIETGAGKKILFDTGQGVLFEQNAARLGLSLADIDIVVISHGHDDHGGGIRRFLELNSKAIVHIRRSAFEPHFSMRIAGLTDISLDKSLKENPRLHFCGDIESIEEGITLFSGVTGECCLPGGNRLLFGPDPDTNDTFPHEQHLIIEEEGRIFLFAGCSHSGIVNIAAKCGNITRKTPCAVFGGMHLVRSGLSDEAEEQFLDKLAAELRKYQGCTFYTMHCTGLEHFERLKSRMNNLQYLYCGRSIKI